MQHQYNRIVLAAVAAATVAAAASDDDVVVAAAVMVKGAGVAAYNCDLMTNDDDD